MDHLAPMSDWDGTKSDPLLIWRTRIDNRFLVEVQMVPLSEAAIFCVFDREHDMECVHRQPVYKVLSFKKGKPAWEDVEDWAHRIREFLERACQYA